MNDLDPQTIRLGLGLLAMTVMLALTVLAMRAVGSFFKPDDPRKVFATRIVLWIGTALLVVILLQLRGE